MKPILFIFSGLPATGKSSLSKLTAKEYKAVYLRIDTIEQALRDLCNFNVQGEGYRLAYQVARDNLNLGHNVVADSCNPIILTRREWENVALQINCQYINIEIVCSDMKEHRNRCQNRVIDVERLRLPTWDEILNREFDPWEGKRITIDTTSQSIEQSFDQLKAQIEKYLQENFF